MTDESVAQTRFARLETEPLAPAAPVTGTFRGAGRELAEIWRYRQLLGRLSRREVKARYKDSSLGVVWSLFRPLAQLLIYYFAIGQVLGQARATPDFAVFVFTGLTMWTLFNEVISSGATSIVMNSGLIKKVYLPREIFPLASVGSALVNFGIQLVVLILGVIFLSSTKPTWPDVLYAPLAFLTLIVVSTAISLTLSALNVYLRDIEHFVEVAMLLLFWMSPIVYSYSFVHRALHGSWLEQLYLANPVTTAVIGFQKGVWAAGSVPGSQQVWPPELLVRLLVTLAVGLVALVVAQRIFSRLQGDFAQEL